MTDLSDLVSHDKYTETEHRRDKMQKSLNTPRQKTLKAKYTRQNTLNKIHKYKILFKKYTDTKYSYTKYTEKIPKTNSRRQKTLRQTEVKKARRQPNTVPGRPPSTPPPGSH